MLSFEDLYVYNDLKADGTKNPNPWEFNYAKYKDWKGKLFDSSKDKTYRNKQYKSI